MTSHNLRQHLTWLLSSKPFIPPPSTQQRATRSFESYPSSATLQNDIPATDVTHIARDNDTSSRRDHLHQENQGAPHRGGEQSVDDMARLKIGPSSASKPRMLMLASPDVKSTSIKATQGHRGAVVGEGKKFHQNAERQFTRPIEDASPTEPGPYKKRANPIDIHQLPPTPSHKFHTVDLTEERPAKSQLSKKRTSEEYGFDTPSRRHKPKKIKDERLLTRELSSPSRAEFVSIDDFDQPNDPPPPYSTVARSRPVLQADVAPFDAALDEYDESLFDGHDDEECVIEGKVLFRTSSRKSPSRLASGTRITDGTESLNAPPSPRHTPPKTIHTVEQSKKPQVRAKARVVEDSEDEYDIDMSDHEPETAQPQNKTFSSPRKPLRTTEPAGQSVRTNLGSPTKSPLCTAPPPRVRSQSPEKAQMVQEVESALLLRRNEADPAADANRMVSDPTKTPIFSSQSIGTTSLSMEEKAKVDIFVGWPDSEMQELVNEARARVDQLEEEALEQEFTGTSAPDLAAQTDKIKVRLQRLESLQRLTRVHRRHVERKDKLWQNLQAVFSEGGMPEQAESDENRDLTNRIKKTSATIFMSLQELGIIDSTGHIWNVRDPSKPTRVMVHSTQVSPFNGVGPEPVLSSSGIRQTQYAGNAQIKTGGADNFINSRKTSHIPRPDQSGRQSPLQQIPHKAPSHRNPSPTRNKQYVHEAGFEDDANLFENQVFTHNMGGIVHSISDDEEETYGDSDEEGIFAEIPDSATENIEPHRVVPQPNPFLKPAIPLNRPSKILSESSGNQAKQPYASQHSTQGKSQAKGSSPKQRHKWTTEVHRVLKNTFHMKGFRPHQEEAINETLAGRDVFVLMPTGGGKSLCYQLPALVKSGKTRGVTVVVSPLLSLMEDQVTHLKDRLGVAAFFINGESTREHRNFVTSALRDSRVEDYISMLYVTPELLSNSPGTVRALHDLYNNGLLARLVIDEAHCVSQWGHDFRPDYKALGEVRKQFEGVPLMALTATATENVKVDVRHNLGMGNCKTLTQSFNRPGLEYEVRKKSRGILGEIVEFIKARHRGKCGIIYCLSRKKCEDVAAKLTKEHGMRASHFHAGMTPADKSQTQRDWQAGKIHIVVATIAFGMGIDKPDVRFVIHHSIPKSLEGYYQETGRAGRDGKKSECVLFYGYQDAVTLKKMVDDGEGDRQQKDRQNQMLRKVVQFCENQSDCRRAQVLLYFNEPFTASQCRKTCDNCRSSSRFEMVDFSEYAAGAIRLVDILKKQVTDRNGFTLLHCVDVFRGAKNKSITDRGHNRLEEYGQGSDLAREDLERLFYHLISENALQEYSVVNAKGFATSYLTIGPRFRAFLEGKVPVQLQVRVTPRASRVVDKLGPKKTSKKKAATAAKSTTGVKAARAMPISTNVSSPVQMSSRRNAVKKRRVCEDEEDDDDDEGFVVPDHEPIREESDDEDAFQAAARSARAHRKAPAKRLSEPITLDARMAELDDVHADIVEQFVAEGKKECMKIRHQLQLRSQPFSDTVLREMAVNWPADLKAMEKIPGISQLSIDAHGARIMRILEKYKTFYDDATRQGEEVVEDPNKRIVNVIDLCSDEEFGSDIDLTADDNDDDDDDDEEEEDSGPLQTSGYFSNNSRRPADRPAEGGRREQTDRQRERDNAMVYHDMSAAAYEQRPAYPYARHGGAAQTKGRAAAAASASSGGAARGQWKKGFKTGGGGGGARSRTSSSSGAGGSFKKGRSAAAAAVKRHSGGGSSMHRRALGGGGGGIGMMPV
ncbi:hypothetical protein EJ05DRAFT_535718 [Pseudovirgaria hyperparasitica]|uniref:DNA 3'-5' helicase n=1 Tax=Pseudovirgaria hyperparasitica TaxID=470096 RepID=A0A6A6WDA4_9PEZI|nr:uncharacterized protein EJ05DRAFT_535718 [Pseudovirgaria hyperparasitica]KAF2760812.1 hypothetical protein EJ05DRAFT_535718 [Pseudovirgaria hyperparasitica]